MGGTLTFDAMTFPLKAGSTDVNVDISLSSAVPASLQTTTTRCTAAASNGDKLFCIEIKSAPAQAVHPERAAQIEEIWCHVEGSCSSTLRLSSSRCLQGYEWYFGRSQAVHCRWPRQWRTCGS